MRVIIIVDVGSINGIDLRYSQIKCPALLMRANVV